jgi:exosortase
MTTAAQFWGPIAATIAVVVLAYGPLLVAFFQNQWQHPQYQFFPFVLAAFGWLLWRSCSQSSPRGEGERRESRVGLMLLLAAAWGLLALAYVANSPWLAIVSVVLLVASRFVRVSGAWRVEYLWGIWAMLLLLVPLPLNRDQWLINKLQHLSSRLSSFFLDWLGVHHLMDGNALRLPDKEFFVDEACSGIVSVMSVIACAVIYGIWRNRSPLHVVLLAAAGVAWATFMNVTRITTIAVAYAWWGVDWSTGTAHETLGLIVFTITFLALVSTDYLLVAFLAPIAKGGDEGAGAPIFYGARIVAWFDRLQAWGTPRPAKAVAAAAARTRIRHELWSRFALGLIPLLAFGTLAAAQFTVPHLMGLAYEPPPAHRLDRALALDEAILPATVGKLRRLEFERQERHRDDISGQYSRIYHYRDDEDHEYVVSCDFPFGPDWHDLRVCYNGTGWAVGQTTIHAVRATGEPEWSYVNVDFAKPEGSSGLLTYCAFDERGTYLVPPSDALADNIFRSFQRGYRSQEPARIFQIQVWTTAPGKVGEKQATNALELLLAARAYLYQSIIQSGAATDGSPR